MTSAAISSPLRVSVSLELPRMMSEYLIRMRLPVAVLIARRASEAYIR